MGWRGIPRIFATPVVRSPIYIYKSIREESTCPSSLRITIYIYIYLAISDPIESTYVVGFLSGVAGTHQCLPVHLKAHRTNRIRFGPNNTVSICPKYTIVVSRRHGLARKNGVLVVVVKIRVWTYRSAPCLSNHRTIWGWANTAAIKSGVASCNCHLRMSLEPSCATRMMIIMRMMMRRVHRTLAYVWIFILILILILIMIIMKRIWYHIIPMHGFPFQFPSAHMGRELWHDCFNVVCQITGDNYDDKDNQDNDAHTGAHWE